MKRKGLPDWMNELSTDSNEEDESKTIEISVSTTIQNEKKVLQEQNSSYITRRSTRSNPNLLVEKIEKPLKQSQLPFIQYKGKIKYLTDSIDIACTCDELMEWVNKQTDKSIIPIAFDMEWPFSFQTGSGKSSVIQLCADEEICYVLQISQLKRIPAAVMGLLSHPKVRLHGVNIKNDFRKLERDFPECKCEILINQCVDLGVWCNQVYNTGGRWSLERLVSFICKLKIDKNKKVRMSKWNVVPLDDAQQLYAAIDVYISQVIYRELEKRELKKKMDEEKFIKEHGEKAFHALQTLL